MEPFSHKLKEPRRKKCRVDSIGAELPILSTDKNRVCKGRLGNYRILVDDWDDIRHLYCNGFFGKGLNSKGPPKSLSGFLKSNYNIAIGMEDRPANDEGDDNDHEPLVLSSCEAFFLSFALGCLVVFNEDNKAMSIQKLWLSLCHSNALFPYQYATYHHFRSKGWVVRSGLKYAGDFVLYKQGPLFYHSTYNVLVCPVTNTSNDGCNEINKKIKKSFEKKDSAVKSSEEATNVPTIVGMDDNMNESNVIDSLKDWASLSGLNRITEQVAKELLLVYIIRPSSSATTNIKIKEFLKFEIKEVVVKRWASNKEREEDDL